MSEHGADSQQSAYSQREFLAVNFEFVAGVRLTSALPLLQSEVGSCQLRVPSAPAAAPLSSAALRPAPTVSATPA